MRVCLTAALALAVGLAGACARQGAPPGGPEDRRPPVVIRTEPDTFAVLPAEDFGGPVRFFFDERVSERVEGTLDDAVIVSPATGEVRVGHGRQSLTVDVAGGFRAGRVYRVTLLPVVRDLFNNQLGDPFELIFSTGAPFTPSVVAGLVWDFVTGDGVDVAEVRAISEAGDSATYVAHTDADGVYALRYLPPGRYRVVAFQDRNRDGVVDAMETQGSAGVLLNTAADSVLSLAIPVFSPDTSAARVTGTEILDSVTVLVEFDDYLDADGSLENVGVSLSSDSAAAPEVRAVYHEHRYAEFVEVVTDSFARLDSLDAVIAEAKAAADRAEQARADSLAALDTAVAADTVPSDTTRAVEDEAAAEGPAASPPGRVPPVAIPGTAGAKPRARPDGSNKPERRLVILLAEGLVPNRAYQLTVTGVVNLHEVPQGGGEAALVLEPPPDTTTVADSMAVPDSLAAPPDTGVSVSLRRPRR